MRAINIEGLQIIRQKVFALCMQSETGVPLHNDHSSSAAESFGTSLHFHRSVLCETPISVISYIFERNEYSTTSNSESSYQSE